jgi:hypothetical protein
MSIDEGTGNREREIANSFVDFLFPLERVRDPYFYNWVVLDGV